MTHYRALLLPLLLLGCFSACRKEEPAQQHLIRQIEATLAKNDDVRLTADLVNLYLERVEAHPADSANNAFYLLRSAWWLHRIKRPGQALDLLKQALRLRPPIPRRDSALRLMADIYTHNLPVPAAVETLHEFAPEVFGASLRPALPFEQRLDTLRATMIEDTLRQKYNLRRATGYLHSAQVFALLRPDAAPAVDYLFTGAEIAQVIKLYDEAGDMFSWIYTDYPRHERAPLALLTHAHLLDKYLKRTEEARQVLEQLLERYPRHELADDARFLLDNLGKTDEEMLRELEGKDSLR